jgi:hypothetical protein
LLFSKIKNELPLVAVFSQEKMHFYFKRLSAFIRAKNKKSDFSKFSRFILKARNGIIL